MESPGESLGFFYPRRKIQAYLPPVSTDDTRGTDEVPGWREGFVWGRLDECVDADASQAE